MYHRSLFLMCLFGTLLVGAFSAPLLAGQINDREITWAVMTELINDEAVPSHLIDVETAEGIVTLTGSVDNLLAKGRATAVAERVKAVRSVINQITVRPAARRDEDIREDVEHALRADLAAHSNEVQVAVKKGVVILSGTVDSWAKEHLSEQVAKGVKGVEDITNEIEVRFTTERPNSEIKAEIERRLHWDVWVDEAFIEVDVKDGKVTLTGAVASAAEKSRAYGDALVAGVASVDHSGLDVDWSLRDKMRQTLKYTYRPDREIEKAIRDAFLYDARVVSFDIDVEVTDGVATLTGIVDDLKAKNAAEDDAESTPGAWRVRNLIRVRPAMRPTDAHIAEKIRDAFLKDLYLDRHEVGVTVRNGKAYLNGTVDSYLERRRAEELASSVKGVVDVRNNLEVYRSWKWKKDWEIKEDIQSQLRQSPFVDSEQVPVTVEDGVATLSGTVENWREHGAATDNAYEGGARKARNRLKGRYGPAYHR